MAKELSKHASVIVYLGIHYENILEKHLLAKGNTLGQRLNAASNSIQNDQRVRLLRFNHIRNVCAHTMGFKTLKNLPEAIQLFNEIEDGFATQKLKYKPEYVTESDFEHPAPTEKIVYVEVPKAKTVYIYKILIPLFVKIGLALISLGLVLGFFIGFVNVKTSDSTSGGFMGFGQNHYHMQIDTPNALFGVIVVGAIVAVIGWIKNIVIKNRAK